ncbi:MAG: hypothetical protein R3267_05605 [Paenisporosarcina sp.]|nr:hypothetical protein [Paenisporosarcina sp.]
MRNLLFISSAVTFLLTLFSPLMVKATQAPLPFMPKKHEGQIEEVSSDSLFGGISDALASLIGPAYSWGIIIITGIFVVGTLVMIMSVLFKNGQWQKFAQGTMFISFVVMLLLRGLPILILSIRNANDIDVLLRDGLLSLSYAAIFLGIISISVSLLFRLGYKLIEHPEFHRWSKNLISVSVLMMILAIAIPILFPII